MQCSTRAVFDGSFLAAMHPLMFALILDVGLSSRLRVKALPSLGKQNIQGWSEGE